MSIERADQGIRIACDSCGQTTDLCDEFTDAMAAFKADLSGRSVKVGDEWINLCGECADERKREMKNANR